MADHEEVVLLGFWPSSYAMRVKIALAEKGIQYESREENLQEKSPLLLQMNPMHKKIPVLIHNGKPVCESLIIIQYIDEVWPHKSPLLPSDPYLRSQARFWADYVDKNIYSIGKRIWAGKGGDKESAKKEMIGFLKKMEGELGDKPFFGGDSLGFVDVALLPFTTWFHTYEILGDFSIEADCTKLTAWANRCSQKKTVSSSLADPHSVLDFALGLKKKMGI